VYPLRTRRGSGRSSEVTEANDVWKKETINSKEKWSYDQVTGGLWGGEGDPGIGARPRNGKKGEVHESRRQVRRRLCLDGLS